MSTRTDCDRCRNLAAFTLTAGLARSSSTSFRGRRWDLCDECWDEFRAWTESPAPDRSGG